MNLRRVAPRPTWILSERGCLDVETGEMMNVVLIELDAWKRAMCALAVGEFEGEEWVAFKYIEGLWITGLEDFARGRLDNCYRLNQICAECGESDSRCLCEESLWEWEWEYSGNIVSFGKVIDMSIEDIESIVKTVEPYPFV